MKKSVIFLFVLIATFFQNLQAQYKLPFPSGTTYTCSQGNSSSLSHSGTERYAYDFSMPIGSSVVAMRSGRVTHVVESFSDGNCCLNCTACVNDVNRIVIEHADGTKALYLHLTRNGADVAVGDNVLQGQVIGRSGNSGKSTGAHLHVMLMNSCSSAWYCQSILLRFDDVSTNGGILQSGTRYTSQNSSRPSAPILGTPTLNSPTSVTLRWSGLSSNTDNVRVQLSTSTGFSTETGFSSLLYNYPSTGVTAGAITQHSVNNLPANTVINWSVRYNDRTLGASLFAQYGTFTTPKTPASLTYPVGNVQNIDPAGIDFRWSGVTGATNVRIQVSESSSFSAATGFTTTVLDYPPSGTQTGAITNYLWRNARPNTTYYWSVRYADSKGSSEYAIYGVFRTGSGTVTCNAPSGLYADQIGTTSARVRWTTNGAGSYMMRYRASTSSTWSTPINVGNVAFRDITGLSPLTNYIFQIAAVCATASSAYTEGSFSTLQNISFSVTPQTMPTFGASGGTQSISITSGSGWSISGLPTWLSVNIGSGNGGSTASVNVTATSNTNSTIARNSSFSVNSGGQIITVAVSQSGGTVTTGCTDGYESNNSFSTASNLAYSGTGAFVSGEACIGVLGDNDYYRFVVAGKTYYALVHEYNHARSGGAYSLSIAVNNGILTIRTSAITNKPTSDTYLYLYSDMQALLRSDDDAGGSNYSLLSYTLPTTTTFSVSPSSHSFVASGESKTIQITASGAWTISSPPTGFSLSTASGSGNATVTITASNNSSTARNGSLTITSGGQTATVSLAQAAGQQGCTDGYESNNIFSTASNLAYSGTGTFVSGEACIGVLGDNDYYRFVVAGKTYYALVHEYNHARSGGAYSLSIVVNNGILTIRTNAITNKPTSDTYLYLYSDMQALLRSDDDAGGSNYSLLSYTLPTTGTNRPANDEPCSATPLTLSGSAIYSQGTTVNATTTTAIPTSVSCNTASNDVWYSLSVPANTSITLRTLAGTITDGVIAIYSMSGGCSSPSSTYSCEDDNNDGNGSYMPVLNWRNPTSQTIPILIRVWGYNGQQGTFSICALNYTTLNSVANNTNNNVQMGKQLADAETIVVNTDNTKKKNTLSGLRLYPNPASNILNLTFDCTQEGIADIRITDVSGRTIQTIHKDVVEGNNIQEIPVSDFVNGFYFVRVTQNGEMPQVQKFQVLKQ